MRYVHDSCNFIVKTHLSCAIALFWISLGIPGKHQAAVRLLGLAWSTSSTSTVLLLLQELQSHKTTAAAAAVTNKSRAPWLGAEQTSGTDTALIWVIHALVMSFHFQREVAWQAHARSLPTGNLDISRARESEQIRGSSSIPNVTGLCK